MATPMMVMAVLPPAQNNQPATAPLRLVKKSQGEAKPWAKRLATMGTPPQKPNVLMAPPPAPIAMPLALKF